jgi:hypothetical protein
MPPNPHDPYDLAVARSEREVLDHYLGRPVAPPEGYEGVHESTLHAALRDCRRAQNCDDWTGYLARGEEADHFLGAVGYLCLIDQVGSAIGLGGGRYETGGLATKKAPYRALYDSTDLSAEVIEAMYGLRCSLAHDYSLVNKHWRPERQHLYIFSGGSDLVQLPSPTRRWDGEWVEDSSERQPTPFNMRRIGDVAEHVVSVARQRHEAGEVRVLCAGGVAEMEMRYFLSHFDYSVLRPPSSEP